jgi:hypothetical protein
VTRLDPEFLRAMVVMTLFKPERSLRCQASLLAMALTGETFTAAQLPGEVTEGSLQAAGAATGTLLTAGLLKNLGRVKSPHKNAHGRKLHLLQLNDGKRETVRTWFATNGFDTTILPTIQTEMIL